MLGLFNLGQWELIAIIVVGVLLFGSRLPSIARSLGKSVTEFKKGVKDINEEVATAEPKKLDEKREVSAEKVETKEAQNA
ncbi:MAG: twin-arginine translocase TatA/TatE family subunit [Planctomycetes bacterium]|nr:twin-arginine translocase TatA/TatE family subunit [Planctomycetota bacterium]